MLRDMAQFDHAENEEEGPSWPLEELSLPT